MVNASLGAATSDMVRRAKRLYVGNLPTTSDAEVGKFFNDVICKIYQPGEHVVSAYVHPDKSFAFLEMKELAGEIDIGAWHNWRGSEQELFRVQ